jgi:hypothetical protein
VATGNSRATRITCGRDAWPALKSESRWSAWALVCDALSLLSVDAMRHAKVNEPKGKGYNTAFSRLLVINGLHEIPKTTRAAAIKCGQHLKRIEAHLDLLIQGDTATWLRMNHPQAVWAAIRPLVMTNDEKRAAERRKEERGREKARKERQQVDLADCDETEVAEYIIHEMAHDERIRLVIKRLLKLSQTKAVVLMGDERPDQLAYILIDECKLTRNDADDLIAALQAVYSPAKGPDP